MDKENEDKCKCCEGLGAQSNGYGMCVVCPACKGTGKWSVALAIVKVVANDALGEKIVP